MSGDFSDNDQQVTHYDPAAEQQAAPEQSAPSSQQQVAPEDKNWMRSAEGCQRSSASDMVHLGQGGRRSSSVEFPDAPFLDGRVHGIRGKIEFAGP